MTPLEVCGEAIPDEIVHDRTGRRRVHPYPGEDAPAPRSEDRALNKRPPRRFLGTSTSLRPAQTPPTVSGMTGLTQPWHIILILLIALMLFGGRRLPEVGRSLGTGMREFKDSITGHDSPKPAEQLNPAEATASASQPIERQTA